MSITPRPRSRGLAAAAEHEHLTPASAARLRVLGVGDDARDLAELGLALDVAVGAHQHRDGAQPAERGDDRERGRARSPSARRRARPGGRRSRSGRGRRSRRGAWPPRGCGRGPRRARRRCSGCSSACSSRSIAERDLRTRANLVEPDQARQLGARLRADLAHVRRGAVARRTASAPGSRPTPPASAEAVARAGLAPGLSQLVGDLDAADRVGQLGRPVAPARPAGDGRPRVAVAVEPTTRPKCPARSATS